MSFSFKSMFSVLGRSIIIQLMASLIPYRIAGGLMCEFMPDAIVVKMFWLLGNNCVRFIAVVFSSVIQRS